MTRSEIETALQCFLVSSSGLPDSKVIIENENGTQPEYPYISYRIGDAIPIGLKDESRWDYDSDRAAGSEIRHVTQGLREFVVNVEAFSDPTSGDGSACALLDRVCLKLSAPLSRQKLLDAGVSPFQRGNVTNMAQLLGPIFAGRSSLEVRIYANISDEEFGTFIQTVEGEGSLSGTTSPFSVTSEEG